MKRLLLVVILFFLVPVHAFSSGITWTSAMLDNRSWDQRYFNVPDDSSVVAWAKVKYSPGETHTTNPPTVDGFSMTYDGKWSDTEDGFYRFFDFGGNLSDFEKDYRFALEGVPGSETSIAIAPNTYNRDFGIPIANINNGLVIWNQVAGATQYRIRLIVPNENGNWWGDRVFQVILDGSTTSFQLEDEWLQNDYVLRMEARGYGDDGNIYHRSSYYTIIEAITAGPNGLTAPTLTYSVDGVSVTLNWSTVPGANGYILNFAPYPYEGPSTIESVNMGTATSFSVDLWDGAAYYIAMQAYNDSESSSYSDIGLIEINLQSFSASDLIDGAWLEYSAQDGSADAGELNGCYDFSADGSAYAVSLSTNTTSGQTEEGTFQWTLNESTVQFNDPEAPTVTLTQGSDSNTYSAYMVWSDDTDTRPWIRTDSCDAYRLTGNNETTELSGSWTGAANTPYGNMSNIPMTIEQNGADIVITARDEPGRTDYWHGTLSGETISISRISTTSSHPDCVNYSATGELTIVNENNLQGSLTGNFCDTSTATFYVTMER